jgi:hypothetical protein
VIYDKEINRLERQAVDARKRASRLAADLEQAHAAVAVAVDERRRILLEGGDVADAEHRAAVAEHALASIADAARTPARTRFVGDRRKLSTRAAAFRLRQIGPGSWRRVGRALRDFAVLPVSANRLTPDNEGRMMELCDCPC